MPSEPSATPANEPAANTPRSTKRQRVGRYVSSHNWWPETLTVVFLGALVLAHWFGSQGGSPADKSAEFVLPGDKVKPRTQSLDRNAHVILVLVDSPDVSAHIDAWLVDPLPLASQTNDGVKVRLNCGVDCSSLEEFARQLADATAIYIIPASPTPTSTVPRASPTVTPFSSNATSTPA
jgi:hypothetical protein